MELLSPAGNFEKLKTIYQYGADAAYIGINHFSLRQKADNFSENDAKNIPRIKGDKKLYGAFNIYFHNQDLKLLEEQADLIAQYPLDAFIVSDIGTISFLQKRFPNVELHLSTQANCINVEAARLYQKMGFKRVILGRETSLNEIKEIKNALPDLELETFIHGAMCLAYSGRCFLSRYMADRSGNKGDCSHTCRWKYNLNGPKDSLSLEGERIHQLAESGQLALEEELRPNEYFPIYEGDGFTTILSSRDLCLIDHLQELVDAGIDSLKIEGRMKSLYYAAVITRAYRKALDNVTGKPVPDLNLYREEIFKVSHREFTTGFFFGDQSVHRTTDISYLRQHIFVGAIIAVEVTEKGDFLAKIDLKNQINQTDKIECIGPDIIYEEIDSFELLNDKMETIAKSDHGKETWLRLKERVEEGYLIRRGIKQNEKPDQKPILTPAQEAGWS